MFFFQSKLWHLRAQRKCIDLTPRKNSPTQCGQFTRSSKHRPTARRPQSASTDSMCLAPCPRTPSAGVPGCATTRGAGCSRSRSPLCQKRTSWKATAQLSSLSPVVIAVVASPGALLRHEGHSVLAWRTNSRHPVGCGPGRTGG